MNDRLTGALRRVHILFRQASLGPRPNNLPASRGEEGRADRSRRLAFGENRTHLAEKGGAAIPIAASLIGLAVAAFVAAAIAVKSGGFIRAAAQTLAIVLASLTGAVAGFLIPLIPFAGGVRGDALAAGILGTLGMIGGMSAAEYYLAWLEKPR